MGTINREMFKKPAGSDSQEKKRRKEMGIIEEWTIVERKKRKEAPHSNERGVAGPNSQS